MARNIIQSNSKKMLLKIQKRLSTNIILPLLDNFLCFRFRNLEAFDTALLSESARLTHTTEKREVVEKRGRKFTEREREREHLLAKSGQLAIA